jgi:lipoprotein-anchoring transpeptidase ErfK/SrfK
MARSVPEAVAAGLVAIVVISGCAPFHDPLAGATGTTSPAAPATVLVEIEPPSRTIVAQAIPPEVVARSEPLDGAEVVAELANPIATGGPLVFQVVEAGSSPGPEWLKVLLPVRPNGTTGWIPAGSVELSENPYRIEIDIAGHELTVLRDGDAVLSTPVAIGTGETPTPVGSFYLTELLQPPDPGGPYGTYAFGLSGFSETLQSFNGGDGVIGIHGTNDPSSLGTDVSHGCVRVANETIEELAAMLPLGTPVVVS